MNKDFELGILLLLKKFKENNIYIDNITIDKSKKHNCYRIHFWYNKKLIDFSGQLKDKNDISTYLQGIFKTFSLKEV